MQSLEGAKASAMQAAVPTDTPRRGAGSVARASADCIDDDGPPGGARAEDPSSRGKTRRSPAAAAAAAAKEEPLLTPTRNAAEEAICRPFLTSRSTSPLIRNLARDPRVDEDGEFSCELVLQDVNLPAQIRITIHEGLSLLMMRHIALGKNRHKTAVRHLRLLAKYIPSKFSFSLNAGRWGLMPAISQPELAVENLHNCLYGKASGDKTATRAERRQARIEYARALAYLGRHAEAREEYGRLMRKTLGETPELFGLFFQQRETATNYRDYVAGLPT